jgi:hypothetical protein
MGKRGPQPKGKVTLKWSANFAYAIGLLVTDGCLYNDGRHISFVSKDLQQVENYIKCLDIKSKIGTSQSGYKKTKAFRVQISDVDFYNFLISIGVTPAKSKTIREVKIPRDYFLDFLRGSFDGDGSFYSYWDPRWRSSHMFYLTFASASLAHIEWLRLEINKRLKTLGHISKSKIAGSIYSLRYAKKEALEIIAKMYYNPRVVCLSRKWLKIQKAILIEKKQQKLYS